MCIVFWGEKNINEISFVQISDFYYKRLILYVILLDKSILLYNIDSYYYLTIGQDNNDNIKIIIRTEKSKSQPKTKLKHGPLTIALLKNQDT